MYSRSLRAVREPYFLACSNTSRDKWQLFCIELSFTVSGNTPQKALPHLDNGKDIYFYCNYTPFSQDFLAYPSAFAHFCCFIRKIHSHQRENKKEQDYNLRKGAVPIERIVQSGLRLSVKEFFVYPIAWMDSLFGLCFVLHAFHRTAQHGVSRFFRLTGITAYAQNGADVETIDQGGRTTTTDQRERLSGHWHQADGHRHVDHGLDDQKQGKTYGQESGETSFALIGQPPHPEEQEHIQ